VCREPLPPLPWRAPPPPGAPPRASPLQPPPPLERAPACPTPGLLPRPYYTPVLPLKGVPSPRGVPPVGPLADPLAPPGVNPSPPGVNPSPPGVEPEPRHSKPSLAARPGAGSPKPSSESQPYPAPAGVLPGCLPREAPEPWGFAGPLPYPVPCRSPLVFLRPEPVYAPRVRGAGTAPASPEPRKGHTPSAVSPSLCGVRA